MPAETALVIDIIAGARPNFMKIAPIIHALEARRAAGGPLSYRLVHTGQHYDARMSGDFFAQLGIPAPDVNLESGSGTQAEQTAASETLNGLIETDADIQAGDSGGPLFNSADQVIGIDTAAEQGGATAGYAIPIETALTIAGQIESGRSSSTVTIGYPAFLGVEVDSASDAGAGSGYGSAFGGFGSGSSTGDSAGAATSGATIAGVIDGSPAAAAGLTAGDTITAVNGTAIDSASALTAALGAHAPGDSVSVTWTDASGASHTASVTLAQGPVA